METVSLKEVVGEVLVFKTLEDKEKLLITLSALSLRLISLSKAAEIMEMSRDALLGLLEALQVDYSYLDESDVEIEISW